MNRNSGLCTLRSLCAEDRRLSLDQELVHLIQGDLFPDDGGLDLVVGVGRYGDGTVGELPTWLCVDELLELLALKVEVGGDALFADRGEGALNRVECDLASGVLKFADLGGVLANVRVVLAGEC